MIKTLVLLFILATASLVAQDHGVVIDKVWTNRVDQIAQIVSSEPIGEKCPECGGPNHHTREIRLMYSYDRIFSRIVYQGRTNQIIVGTHPGTNWVSTNIVYNGSAPLPPSTNYFNSRR